MHTFYLAIYCSIAGSSRFIQCTMVSFSVYKRCIPKIPVKEPAQLHRKYDTLPGMCAAVDARVLLICHSDVVAADFHFCFGA